MVTLLDEAERQEVKRLGFGTFLELTVGNISKRQAVDWLFRVAVLEKDLIAIHIW